MRLVWHSGPPDSLPALEDRAVIVWYVRLDEPWAADMAARCRLSAEDLRDLAGRPDAMTRGIRRRLARVLLATMAHIHPDEVCFARNDTGAPVVLEPAGWHVSLAGQWPHCLIGLARQPLGVDIEPADGAGPPEDALTAAERQWLAQRLDREATALWVLKEAHAKCHGVASRIEAGDIETRFDWGGEEEGKPGSATSSGLHSECLLRKIAGTWQAVALAGWEGPGGCRLADAVLRWPVLP